MRKPHGRPENFLTPVKPKDEPKSTDAEVLGTVTDTPPPSPFGAPLDLGPLPGSVPLPFPDDVTAETPLGDGD